MAFAMTARDRPLLNLGLLGATVLTTWATFRYVFLDGAELTAHQKLLQSLGFSLCLMLILGAHEMGHYVLARRHGVDSSLPYFIPLPLLGVGTLGAVIRLRGRIPDRNALVDIGAAGPLAGVVVAIPILLLGLHWSQVVPAPLHAQPFPGDSSLWVLVPELVKWVGVKVGVLHPALTAGTSLAAEGAPLFGDNLMMLGLERLTVGALGPGRDVLVHPIVIAGWFGLLVTMLNLIPIGQLDGGHLTYALFGDRARTVGKWMAAGLLFLCIFETAGWVLWLLISVKLIGFSHPPVVDDGVPVTRGRKLICWACAVVFVLCVTPLPISVSG